MIKNLYKIYNYLFKCRMIHINKYFYNLFIDTVIKKKICDEPNHIYYIKKQRINNIF